MTRRLVNVFEETVDAAPGQAPYQRTIPLAAGRYRLDVIVKDVTSGSVTDREMAIEVPAPEARYVIGARDTLSVMVDGEKGYSGRYLVRPDGRISMPSLGEVPAAGRTPEELRQDLAERLAAWVKAPQVSVAVAAVHGK
jgi:protein involved in polysaccharide export with SLBB domain